MSVPETRPTFPTSVAPPTVTEQQLLNQAGIGEVPTSDSMRLPLLLPGRYSDYSQYNSTENTNG